MSWTYPNLSWPDGQPIDQDWILFAAAPEEIGVPLVAATTLSKSEQSRRAKLRLLIPWAIPVSCAVVNYLTLPYLGSAIQSGILAGITLITTSFVTWHYFQRVSRFQHTLVYLSEKGIACFECIGSTEKFHRREVLLFSQATALFTKQNSAGYEFYWKDAQDRLAFRWEGRFEVKGVEPPRCHIVHALRAAEKVWTSLFVGDAIEQIGRGGGVSFPLLGKGSLRLTSSQLTLTEQLRTQVLGQDDIESFQRDSRNFEIVPSFHAKTMGFTGIEIAVEQVGNLNALTELLSRYFRIKGQ